MRIIRALSDMDSSLDPAVERLVRQRLEMLAEYEEELARFIITEPGDTIADVEKEIGFAFSEALWEWVIDHGGLFEAPFITSDDGSGNVLLVKDGEGVDPELVSLCRANAEPAASTKSGMI